jgi:hypothetical protein
MTRHGGTAEIRSHLGGGTEVKLRMERVRSAATAMNSSGELIVSQPAE